MLCMVAVRLLYFCVCVLVCWYIARGYSLILCMCGFSGIYAATGPDTPMAGYARNTNRVILCRALPGTECQGQRGLADVDMWRPRDDWVVFADAASLLPVYVVRYTSI